MDQIDAGQRCLGKPGDQVHGVVEVQTDVAQAAAFDRGERFGHAVDEGFDADNAGAGMLARLRDHRFTAAETDFERNIADRYRKQHAQIERRRSGKIERQQRQQSLDQLRLVRAELVTFAPAKERAG